MHIAGANQVKTKNLVPSTEENPSAISVPARVKSAGNLGLPHGYKSPTTVASEETRELLKGFPSNISSYIRRPSSFGLQSSSAKPSNVNASDSLPKMDSLNHSNDRGMGKLSDAPRWYFNATGQLVHSDSPSAEWDLAQDIARLGIVSTTDDLTDDVHGQMRTPPQPKIGATVVAAFNQSSPLETSSDTSVGSSPHRSEHQKPLSHSRGSSTDTLSSRESALSSTSNTLRGAFQLRIDTSGEPKERPHSFSGGLSSADLRRLQRVGEQSTPSGETPSQNSQWTSSQHGNFGVHEKLEQPIYPSLQQSLSAPRAQQPIDRRPTFRAPAMQQDDSQTDYIPVQQNYMGVNSLGANLAYNPGRHANGMPPTAFRQPLRGFPPQPFVPNATALPYGGGPVPHPALRSGQQLYDMAIPPHLDNPAVTRVQQQHNAYRGNHQHSASDPSTSRDMAALALLNNGMQAFSAPAPGLYPSTIPHPGLPLYAGQFYGAEAFPHADLLATQAMAAQLQSQFASPYGVMTAQAMAIEPSMNASAASNNGHDAEGPTLNNRKLGLYKTELCRSWEEKGSCRYGGKCQFAHGEEELRKVSRHPKYKTEICRTFWVSGSCPYGKRCCFIHTELSGPSGADAIPPSSNGLINHGSEGHERSSSTASDNDVSVSLLPRIQWKNEAQNAPSPTETSTPSTGFFNSRPPTGSLRVDTSTLNPSVMKQNKSAYPTFASSGLVFPSSEQAGAMSPVPLTAGPDLGRHNSARVEIVGYPQKRINKTTINPSVRHSFNGTEVDFDLTKLATPAGSGSSTSFEVSSIDRNSNAGSTPRSHHVRSGSAGNWASLTRGGHLTSSSFTPLSSGGSGEVRSNSPWLANELSIGSSRLNETWI